MDKLINDIDNTDFNRQFKVDSIEECKPLLGDTGKQYTVVTQNIRSINKNFNNFFVMLNRLSFSPDIIVLTECWLDEDSPCFKIDNYNCYYSQTYFNQNDGIVVFTKIHLQVNFTEPPFQESNCLIIDVNNELTLIALYRSPSYKKITKFCESLRLIMETFSGSTCAIVGDLNLDIKPGYIDDRSTDYLELTALYGYFPGHTFITRGVNCYDHVLLKTKREATVIVCGTGITDHDTVMFGINKNTQTPISKKYITKIDYPGLISEIESEDWDYLYEIRDVNRAAKLLVDGLTEKITKHTTKRLCRSSEVINKPWITQNLLKCIRRRDALHIKANKKHNLHNPVIQQEYKTYRNYCNNILTNLKVEYERNLLANAVGNNKKLWSEIKHICNIKNKRGRTSELMTGSDTPELILNRVNNYFITIGETLAEKTLSQLNLTEAKLASNARQCDPYSKDPDSFFLTPTDEVEISKIITNLKVASSAGHDGINNKILKSCAHVLVKPITFLCNLSMEKSTVPTGFKIANICPIYKSGDPKTPSNYRPISLLTTLSKVLERVVNRRLLAYLEKKKLLSDNQFGFRAARSTEDAVSSLVDFISHKLDQNMACTGIFLDLAKAFDTVSRKILIRKMEFLGVRGDALAWFSSYLADRKQKVVVGDYCSELKPVNYGVPQGSVLGPTLFIIYINGLCAMDLPQAKIVTYADDTAIVFSGKTWHETQNNVERGLQKVASWLQQNLLTLNIDKTKAINFYVSKRSSPKYTMSLKLHLCSMPDNCNCAQIEQVDSMKYLGIFLDCALKWNKNISVLTTRTRRLIRVFKRLGKVANDKILKMVYFSLCQSTLNYCITVWGAAGKDNMIKVERAQRALLKVTYGRPFRYPTNLLYSELELLSVRKLYILSVTLRFHGSALSSASESYTGRRLIWQSVRCRKEIGRRSYSFMGPYIYRKINAIHNIVRLTRRRCKDKVYKWLLQLDYDTTEQILVSVQ